MALPPRRDPETESRRDARSDEGSVGEGRRVAARDVRQSLDTLGSEVDRRQADGRPDDHDPEVEKLMWIRAAARNGRSYPRGDPRLSRRAYSARRMSFARSIRRRTRSR